MILFQNVHPMKITLKIWNHAKKKNLGEEESRNSMNTINIPDFIILIIYIIQSAVKCQIKVKMKVNNCRYFNINFNIQM